jgi:CheY-like chemotaxis protein
MQTFSPSHIAEQRQPNLGPAAQTCETARGDSPAVPCNFRVLVPEAASTQPRVLIVDDDTHMARAVRRVLDRAGYVTALAHDGLQAGLMLASFNPHVVTLDILMQGMSGIGVLKFVRNADRFRSPRVLVLSASNGKQLQDAVSAGADDVLTKPFENETLLERVARLARTAWSEAPESRTPLMDSRDGARLAERSADGTPPASNRASPAFS